MIVDAGSIDEFVPGVPRAVVVGGREVMVVNWRDRWYGLRNVCSHQADTLLGGVTHEIGAGARLGDYTITDRLLIACPRHSWTFDLRTGQCTVDPALRVRAYDVSVRDKRVLIDDRRTRLSARPVRHSVHGPEPGSQKQQEAR